MFISVKPDLYIYLDEFERGDVFTLSVVLIPADQAAQVLADWDALRKKIKTVLLKDYPAASHHPKLQGNQLPEIHAVELFQSQGYYRKHKPGTFLEDKYWLQHYEWLEEALKIVQKHNLSFLTFPHSANSSLVSHEEALTWLFENVFKAEGTEHSSEEKKGYSLSKFESLVKNKYFTDLPKVLVFLEQHLREMGKYGEIICDDNDMSKGFLVTNSIDWLREKQHYENLTRPRFASSLDESLIQVCDVLSYISGQALYANVNEENLKSPLHEWMTKYVLPCMLDRHIMSQVLEALKTKNIVFIIAELIAEICVYDDKIKDVVKKANREFQQDHG